MHWAEGQGKLPQGTAERWEEHTPKGKKLPQHVAKGKKKGKGMNKKAFFAGFDKRADQVAGAEGAPGEPVPAEGASEGGAAGPPPAPEKMLKWNPSGGVDPRSPEEMAQAQAVDLVTFPESVEGANCGNCQFFRGLDPGLGTGFCTHPEVKLDVTNRMCCVKWNAPDTYRAWEAVDPSAVPDPSIMGEAGQMAAGEMAMDPGAVDPATGQPLDPAAAGGAPGEPAAPGAPGAAEGGKPAKKPEKKKDSKDKEKPSEGGKGETNVHVHVGGAGEKDKGSEKKAFWTGFDT